MLSNQSKEIGRPTKYKEEYDKKAYGLCLNGHTNKSLAAAFGVHESTFYEWLEKYKSFREAVSLGKAEADTEVVKNLYHLATKEDPDIRAIQLWLRNRNHKEFAECVPLDIGFKPESTLMEKLNSAIEAFDKGKINLQQFSAISTSINGAISNLVRDDNEKRIKEIGKALGMKQ
ncbi:hypothetical protein AB832_07275 [Flavobacteriaceae bacterium (ex Bugula neritina AB1)]|jgi:hypothetical protein|nr:hypothetical protein AB832_07275 [Flavobacteriaceae bacterium (ex Bugula neritina AB1)]